MERKLYFEQGIPDFLLGEAADLIELYFEIKLRN